MKKKQKKTKKPTISKNISRNLLTQIDFIGERFFNGFVNCVRYKFQCECGNTKFCVISAVKTNRIKSCGCINFKNGLIHGMSKTRFWNIYKGILGRCNNPSSSHYNNYGGRGIKCEWEIFDNFKEDMYKGYLEHCEEFGEKQTTIDRKDNNLNYCKENCRRATREEQQHNRRDNIYLEIGGIIKSIYERAYLHGIGLQSMRYRQRKGYSEYGAVLTISNKIGENQKKRLGDS